MQKRSFRVIAVLQNETVNESMFNGGIHMQKMKKILAGIVVMSILLGLLRYLLHKKQEIQM